MARYKFYIVLYCIVLYLLVLYSNLFVLLDFILFKKIIDLTCVFDQINEIKSIGPTGQIDTKDHFLVRSDIAMIMPQVLVCAYVCVYVCVCICCVLKDASMATVKIVVVYLHQTAIIWPTDAATHAQN